jgi:hypothetical protein
VIRAALLAIGLSVAAGASSASQVTLDTVSGTWDVLSTTGSPVITGEGTNQINWGREWYAGEGTSGFRFVGDEDTGPFAIDERFRVGTFTHLNKVIHQGEMVRKARLNLDVTAVFDGVSRLFSTSYDFWLWETPNLQSPTCLQGNMQANYQGANINGCADNVKLLRNDSLTEIFSFGGKTYTFVLEGFAWGTDWWTTERRNNTTPLYARFVVVDDLTEPPPPPPVIPLPAPILGLLTGLAALAGFRRLSRS